MARPAGGLISISGRFTCASLRFLSQMAPPIATVAAICASKMERKNFQNSRPTISP
ncbi:hypothetical protein D3C86_2173620 [compost metagenome]